MGHMASFDYPVGKTTYHIKNEYGAPTTIKLDKWVADILQKVLQDVAAYLQLLYIIEYSCYPFRTRLNRGDKIRQFSTLKANSYQQAKKEVLGWNVYDVLDSLELNPR